MSEKKITGINNFALCGNLKINDGSFKSETFKSGWKKDTLRFGVQTDEGNTVYVQLEGGMHTKKENTVYVKNNDNQNMQVAWEDRFNEKILEVVNKYSKTRIGVEKDVNDKTFVKNFIANTDAIEYLHSTLKNDMRVLVKGDIEYSYWNGKTYRNLNVKEIYLSKNEEGFAHFTQSIFFDSYAIDKAEDVILLNCFMPRYTNKVGEIELKQTLGYPEVIEIPYTTEMEQKIAKAMIQKFFKIKDGYRKLTLEGKLIEGTTIEALERKDLDKATLELIELGIVNEEDVLGKLTVKGNKQKKMVFEKLFFSRGEFGSIDFNVLEFDNDEFKTIEQAMNENGEQKSEEVNLDDALGSNWLDSLGLS